MPNVAPNRTIAPVAEVKRGPYTALDFIADQLRAANAEGEWDSMGVDRARELGAILLRNGIIELSKLAATKLTVTVREFPWAEPVEQTQIALMYQGRQIGYLGSPTEPTREPWLKNYTLLAWSAEGHGNVSYVCRFSPQGFTIVPVWASSSDWGTFREIVRFFVTVFVMYLSAGTASGAGASVGSAVVGASFAAAYPALTAIIGNIAIGAYFSGGDVKGTVRGALLSYAGGSLGDMAGQAAYTATQIEIIASLTDSAVTALATGRDMEKAVQETLLRYGFSSVADMMQATGETAVTEIDMSDNPAGGGVDPYGPGSGWGYDIGPGDWSVPSSGTGEMTFEAAPDVAVAESGGFFNLGNTSLPPVTFDPGAAVGFSGGELYTGGQFAGSTRVEPPMRSIDSGQAVNMANAISSLAINALRVNQAWNQARNPQPVTQARTVTAGAVTSGNDSGVIITRRADGSVSTSKPPVGVPHATTTGNFILNNGNGTYDLIAPDGSRRVIAYGENAGPSQFSLSSLPWPLIAGGAGLLFSILK